MRHGCQRWAASARGAPSDANSGLKRTPGSSRRVLYVRQLRVLAVGRAEGPKPDVARFIPLPMVGSDRREVLRTRDLARGWKVVSFWGARRLGWSAPRF